MGEERDTERREKREGEGQTVTVRGYTCHWGTGIDMNGLQL